jgi:hypothetical protein
VSNKGVRLKVNLVALVLVSVPAELKSDYLFASSEPWSVMSDAVARVRFETQQSLPSNGDALTLHTAVVLGTFQE